MKFGIHDSVRVWQAILTSVVAIVVIVVYGVYKYRVLESELNLAKEENITLTTQLEGAEKDKSDLSELSTYQQSIIDSFQGQIEALGGTVGDLEKLAKTDPELLNKYSKVYFLNENYVPLALAEVAEEYTFSDNGNFLIHAEVWPHLKRLLDEARVKKVELLVASAFRSFDTQATLKSGYTVVYGTGANQFSADQGYSEHQLGTSVDFTTKEAGGNFSKFESDPAYKWLTDNAYRYGFVLSYPEGNTYYRFEPWHWRFVGVELATELRRDGKHFYDLEQREIDTYLIKLFD
jgi:LAS superfamily LD-carboxypeptidase LdcB